MSECEEGTKKEMQSNSSEVRIDLSKYSKDLILSFINIPNKSIEKALLGVREDVVYIDLTNNRLTRIQALENYTSLKRLDLCANQIGLIEGLECQREVLIELDLYENHLETVSGLDFPFMTYLDLSFNRIRKLGEHSFEKLPKLRELYLVQNKIKVIEDVFRPLGCSLKTLELGSNRIRKIENLHHLTNLENLWIGRNKISQIENLQGLSCLRVCFRFRSLI